MQNIEVKHELRDPELAEAICRGVGAMHASSMAQTDTYFRIADGRLKRREVWDLSGGEGVEPAAEDPEWIFYHREDAATPRVSRYVIYSEHDALERFGLRPLPVLVVVRKRRELWLKDNVRIHIDDVEGLGRFIEFEAVVSRKQSPSKCRLLVGELRRAFGPAMGEPIAPSYADLLMDEQEQRVE